MTKHVVATLAASTALLISGCSTVPETTPTASKAAAPKPAHTPVLAPMPSTQAVAMPTMKAPDAPESSQVHSTVEAPKLSAEATALVERLTSTVGTETLPHEVASTTGFPSALSSLQPGAVAPQVEAIDMTGQPPVKGLTADGNTTALFEKDWTGLVLVPINTSLSKAYTSDLHLMKVEAHPLNDGRVRIWTRVKNIGSEALRGEIACEFRMTGSHANSPYFYRFDVPPHGFRDVFFVSPDGTLNSYTVLVRSKDALDSRR
jgi:hypothetical protein